MWVAVGPMLIDDTTLTIKLMTSCQLSTPGGLVFLMLPEWSTTKQMSNRHSATDVYHITLAYSRFYKIKIGLSCLVTFRLIIVRNAEKSWMTRQVWSNNSSVCKCQVSTNKPCLVTFGHVNPRRDVSLLFLSPRVTKSIRWNLWTMSNVIAYLLRYAVDW